MSKTSTTVPKNTENVDIRDPDPWLALELDQSLPMNKNAKTALLACQRSWTRRLLLPFVRPVARLMVVLVQVIRIILPDRIQSPLMLHKLIYWGLKYFVSKEANYLILRHFNIGSEMLRFMADNLSPSPIETTKPLHPRSLKDLSTDAFLVHDLNVFNFIIELNTKVGDISNLPDKIESVDYSAITDGEFDFDELPDKWHNFLDLQTAIEIYTPLYGLMLTDKDFWRASNSLQLDETFALYVARIFGDNLHLSVVHNGHPTIPISTLEAAFRLMLHGLDAECLHGYILKRKKTEIKPILA